MVPGISSYTYTWAIGVPGKEPQSVMTIYQLIDKAVELEVPIVQVADNLPLDRFCKTELFKIRNYASYLGIQIEVGAKKMTVENLKKYINIASFFKSSIVRFVIDGDDYLPELNEVCAVIENVIPLLNKHNIVLAIENHDRFTIAEFVTIVEFFGSDFITICLDSVNSMGAGEGLETVIGQLAPITSNLHVKEFIVKRLSHKMGFVIEGCPLGEGMLPTTKLITQVSDKCRSAILEQWTPPEDTIEKTIEKEASWAEQSIKYLKEILQNI